MSNVRFIGLDVHAETIAVAAAEPTGEVRALGKSLGRLREAELAAYRAREVAIVFQSDNLWPALSAYENVAASLRLAGAAGVGLSATQTPSPYTRRTSSTATSAQ